MYKLFMPVYEGKKTETITAKVSADQLAAFDEIAKEEDRHRSYVVRELALRGLAQYKQDGQLKLTKEEEKAILTAIKKGRQTTTVGLKDLDKKDKKRAG